VHARAVSRRSIATAALAAVVLVAAATSASALAGSASGRRSPERISGTWNLVFADEFGGGSLDSSRWHTCFWWATTTCSIEPNHEQELYNAADVSVSDGLLHLRAQKRDVVAWNSTTYHYSSGMVMTGGRKGVKPPGFTFTYGYAVARVRVPRGKGLWPAFWLLPASYSSRPEIDVMEILGDSPSIQRMNFHYVKADGSRGDAGLTWSGPDFSAGWHTFGVDWQASAIVWYVDGVERWRFADPSVIPDEPMYLLANLAVGGSWPGAPDPGTPFPSYYDVDYVRVWQPARSPPADVSLPNPRACRLCRHGRSIPRVLRAAPASGA